jgi:hypothetical protein
LDELIFGCGIQKSKAALYPWPETPKLYGLKGREKTEAKEVGSQEEEGNL